MPYGPCLISSLSLGAETSCLECALFQCSDAVDAAAADRKVTQPPPMKMEPRAAAADHKTTKRRRRPPSRRRTALLVSWLVVQDELKLQPVAGPKHVQLG